MRFIKKSTLNQETIVVDHHLWRRLLHIIQNYTYPCNIYITCHWLFFHKMAALTPYCSNNQKSHYLQKFMKIPWNSNIFLHSKDFSIDNSWETTKKLLISMEYLHRHLADRDHLNAHFDYLDSSCLRNYLVFSINILKFNKLRALNYFLYKICVLDFFNQTSFYTSTFHRMFRTNEKDTHEVEQKKVYLLSSQCIN